MMASDKRKIGQLTTTCENLRRDLELAQAERTESQVEIKSLNHSLSVKELEQEVYAREQIIGELALLK